ncbi:translation initiation factor eIF-2B subunit delta, putative [Hepatocystis sp. ex Piliocolobus tephrosceles]|nr:translation initiation factor eIF-2B subunit delta, putative [Hepatocystis sp. ex Piliocolobus tephrosceles]
MDEKSYLTFSKRKKKKVNGKINKEKSKKNVFKTEKYMRVSALNKNINSKTFLHTLFKSFIKPYNEKNTAFYAILCIINNIYKCQYFIKHRCFICKSFHEEVHELNEDKLYNYSSDEDGNSCSRYNLYYHMKRNKNAKVGKVKNSPLSNINTNNMIGSMNINNSSNYCGKNRTNSNATKDLTSTNRKHFLANMCDISNLLKSKLNMPSNAVNMNDYHFLIANKMGFSDLYNFDLFDKINIYDRMLLDLNQSEIHPNILRTGIFFNKRTNTSHNHRNVDLLIALKSFIKDYTLPPYEPITRHMKIFIDKEINYIIMCKKHSVSMGEVIRWFKNMIAKHIGKTLLEETKEIITNNINNYIRTKIVIPSINISNYISDKIINNNDILLIYTFDYDIYLSIVKAKKNGKNFEIIIVDSEPYKNSYNIKLYTKLGIPVTYTLISGLFYNIKKCTKVLLGIDAIIHNSVYGYVGTSVICMVSNINNVQVYIVCETYKISNKIMIDSFCMNNINNNLDIYDYIYMHHYHHSTSYNFVNKTEKPIDHSLSFNKKLNNFIDSYADITSSNILFNDGKSHNRNNRFNQIRTGNSNKTTSTPIITYSLSSSLLWGDRKKKNNKKKIKNNNNSNNNNNDGDNKKNACIYVPLQYEKKNNYMLDKHTTDSLTTNLNDDCTIKHTTQEKKYIKNSYNEAGGTDETKNSELLACVEVSTSNSNDNFLLHNDTASIDDKKTNSDDINEICNSNDSVGRDINIVSTKKRESSPNNVDTVEVDEKNDKSFLNEYNEKKRNNNGGNDGGNNGGNNGSSNDNRTLEEFKKLKETDTKGGTNYTKDTCTTSISSIMSSKIEEKHIIINNNISKQFKNEKEIISFDLKENYNVISASRTSGIGSNRSIDSSNEKHNVIIKNKFFINSNTGKTMYESSLPRPNNLKNVLSHNTSYNLYSQGKPNENCEGTSISCNHMCDSICKKIGNINIKNVCTDKHNEINMFSSVLSHIDKINSNTDKSFYIANICNDITPLKYISYIVTEVGVYTSENKNALNVFIQNNL